MKANFNFKSAICTDRFQSERLLALGLKKETTDMCLSKVDAFCQTFDLMSPHKWTEEQSVSDTWYPAWSLDRLIELIPENIITGVRNQWHRVMYNSVLTYEEGDDSLVSFRGGTIYDRCISCIYWLIKEGHFPKEYLCEN